MGEIPGNRTSAMLLLVMAILVGDGVRAGSSVLENAVDREEGGRDDGGNDPWNDLSSDKRRYWNAASGWRPRDRWRDYDWSGEGGDAAVASRRLDPQGTSKGGVKVEVETTQHGISGDQREQVARERDYLNGLVAESAARTREQACNVAFAKTHKTASTTLAMILVRYARRHDKELASFGGNHVSAIPLPEAVQQVRNSGQRVDVMHYHYTDSGTFKKRWEEATRMYEKIMQDGERISYVTVVRNHRAHFLSYYYYFVQPEVQLSIEHFFQSDRKDVREQKKRLMNPLCLEFGIFNKEQLIHFVEKELPDFRLVLLTEEFDEGLMVLRRLMGWDMIDMTYSRMMETKKGTRRWDGKNLLDVPSFDSLSQHAQQAIDVHTNLDRRLYEASERLYRARKEVAAIEIETELEEFERLQGVVNGYLAQNESSEARHWYTGGVQPYLGGPPFYPF